MKRVWVIARVTFHEAVRKKMLAMAFAAGLGFLILFSTALHFQAVSFQARISSAFLRERALSPMLMMGIYAVNFLVVAITVLASVDTLSGEIASGAIQAVATKPIARWELLAGKWLGFCAMLTLYILVMFLGVNGVARAITGASADHLLTGFLLMWMESMLLLSTTICLSVSLSTLTTGVLVLGLHGLAFLGGWIEQAGALTNTPKALLVGVTASLIMPSEALWRRAAFEMQSPLVTASNFTPFSGASVPSGMMILYAGLYTAMAFGLAVRRLSKRDL